MLLRTNTKRCPLRHAKIGDVMSSTDNKAKALRGIDANRTLERAISDLRADGQIIKRRKRVRLGYPGYSQSQFYGSAIATLPDKQEILLYSTSSIRSDRIKEQQWDAYHIKQIDKQITKAFIIVPDESAFDQGTGVRDKIRGGKHFSAIDDILTVDEFTKYVQHHNRTIPLPKYDPYALIEDEAFELDGEDAPSPTSPIIERSTFFFPDLGAFIMSGLKELSIGADNDKRGRKFENVFAAIMDNEDNLKHFKKEKSEDCYFFDLFEKVMAALEITSDDVVSMSADTDIKELENGGSPKTDVLITVRFKKRRPSVQHFTFSLKATKNSSVTVHEYTADTFANALDKNNDELRRLLNEFQAAGSRKDMNPNDAEALTEELRPYRKKLDIWALSGRTSDRDNGEQFADYLLSLNVVTGRIHLSPIEEYCEELEAANTGVHGFGTVFSWTYPHKKRGRRIQLKVKV